MSKKLFSCLSVIALFSFPAFADYIQTVDLYDYSIGNHISWSHTYDFSETGPVDASLIIVADDVDLGEFDQVYINGTLIGELVQQSFYSNWSYDPGPGNSNQGVTTTIFDLDPSLLDWTMPITVQIASNWGVEIETSTLKVTSRNVPEPSSCAFLLIGLTSLALFARKKIEKC